MTALANQSVHSVTAVSTAMPTATWASLQQPTDAIVTFPFDSQSFVRKSSAPTDLESFTDSSSNAANLYIGDRVVVLEQCGEWYRGLVFRGTAAPSSFSSPLSDLVDLYSHEPSGDDHQNSLSSLPPPSTKPVTKPILAIFPASSVRLRKTTSSPPPLPPKSTETFDLNATNSIALVPAHDTAAGAINPLIDDLAAVLRDWSANLEHYISTQQYDLFAKVKDLFSVVFNSRRKLIATAQNSGTLSADEFVREVRNVIAKVEEGEKIQEADIILRNQVTGTAISERDVGMIDILRRHQIAGGRREGQINALTSGTSSSNSMKVLDTYRHRFFHFLLEIRECPPGMCEPGERMELSFSVFNRAESRFVTDEYIIIVDSAGIVTDTSTTSVKNRAFFVDFTERELNDNMHLVCRIVRVGRMHPNGGAMNEAPAAVVQTPQVGSSVNGWNVGDDAAAGPQNPKRAGVVAGGATGGLNNLLRFSERNSGSSVTPSLGHKSSDGSLGSSSASIGNSSSLAGKYPFLASENVEEAAGVYRRPYGCAVLEVGGVLQGRERQASSNVGDDSENRTVGYVGDLSKAYGQERMFRMHVFGPNVEANFGIVHEQIVHGTSGSGYGNTPGYDRHSRGDTVTVSMRMFHGDALGVLRNYCGGRRSGSLDLRGVVVTGRNSGSTDSLVRGANVRVLQLISDSREDGSFRDMRRRSAREEENNEDGDALSTAGSAGGGEDSEEPALVAAAEGRNSIYVTLVAGEFTQALRKTSGRNVEVTVQVRLQTGEFVSNCLSRGSGDPSCRTGALDSLVYYHCNHPRWNETIRIDLSPRAFESAHLLLTFRHCSSKTNESGKRTLSSSGSNSSLRSAWTGSGGSGGVPHITPGTLSGGRSYSDSTTVPSPTGMALPSRLMSTTTTSMASIVSSGFVGTTIAPGGTEEKCERNFAFAFLPLVQTNSNHTVVADGTHILSLYKWDRRACVPGVYLSCPPGPSFAPSLDNSGTGLESFGNSSSRLSVIAKESVTVSTALVSTYMTQNTKLLNLLHWRNAVGFHRMDVLQVVGDLMQVSEVEVVTFLRQILDSLFEILESVVNYDERWGAGQQHPREWFGLGPQGGRYSDAVFGALVMALGVVMDKRFVGHLATIEAHLEGRRTSGSASEDRESGGSESGAFRRAREAAVRAEGTANTEGVGSRVWRHLLRGMYRRMVVADEEAAMAREVRSMVKVWQYLFRMVVCSYGEDVRARTRRTWSDVRAGNAETTHEEFLGYIGTFFAALNRMMALRTPEYLIGSQTLAMVHFPSLVNELVLKLGKVVVRESKEGLGDWANSMLDIVINFVDAMEGKEGDNGWSAMSPVGSSRPSTSKPGTPGTTGTVKSINSVASGTATQGDRSCIKLRTHKLALISQLVQGPLFDAGEECRMKLVSHVVRWIVECFDGSWESTTWLGDTSTAAAARASVGSAQGGHAWERSSEHSGGSSSRNSVGSVVSLSGVLVASRRVSGSRSIDIPVAGFGVTVGQYSPPMVGPPVETWETLTGTGRADLGKRFRCSEGEWIKAGIEVTAQLLDKIEKVARGQGDSVRLVDRLEDLLAVLVDGFLVLLDDPSEEGMTESETRESVATSPVSTVEHDGKQGRDGIQRRRMTAKNPQSAELSWMVVSIFNLMTEDQIRGFVSNRVISAKKHLGKFDLLHTQWKHRMEKTAPDNSRGSFAASTPSLAAEPAEIIVQILVLFSCLFSTSRNNANSSVNSGVEVFPASWPILHLISHRISVKVFRSIGRILKREFPPHSGEERSDLERLGKERRASTFGTVMPELNAALWGDFFRVILQLLASPWTQIETFRHVLARFSSKVGPDIRVDAVAVLQSMWEDLAEHGGDWRLGPLGGRKARIGAQWGFIQELVGEFLRMTISGHPTVRAAGAELLFSAIETEFIGQWALRDLEIGTTNEVDGRAETWILADFMRVEVECIDRIDQLIMGNNSIDQAFAYFIVHDLQHRAQDGTVVGRRFLDEVGDPTELGKAVAHFRLLCSSFSEKLEHLIDLTITVRDFPKDEADTDEQVSAILKLMRFLQTIRIDRESPSGGLSVSPAYVKYAHALSKIHLRSGHLVEAAAALKLHADLLDWSYEMLVSAIPQAGFPRTETALERKLQIYEEMIEMLEKGKAWESASALCRELAAVHSTVTFDYNELSLLFRRQARLAESIILSSQRNQMPSSPTNFDTSGASSQRNLTATHFYSVGFFGLGWDSPELQNRQFVYMAEEWERIAQFIERIMGIYPGASVIREMAPVSKEIQNNPNGMWIQVTAVTPQMDPRSLVGPYGPFGNIGAALGVEYDPPSNRSPPPLALFERDLDPVNPEDAFVASAFDTLESRVPDYVRLYYEVMEVDLFSFSRRIRKPCPAGLEVPTGPGFEAVVEILELWSERTVLATEEVFPGVSRRSHVSMTHSFELSPIENAIIAIRSKNTQLLGLLRVYEPHARTAVASNVPNVRATANVNLASNGANGAQKSKRKGIGAGQLAGLQALTISTGAASQNTPQTASNGLGVLNVNPFSMAILGAVDAPVNGGIPMYRRAFLSDEYRKWAIGTGDHKEVRLIDALMKSIEAQAEIINNCLHVHDWICPSPMRPLHENLILSFQKTFVMEIQKMRLRVVRADGQGRRSLGALQDVEQTLKIQTSGKRGPWLGGNKETPRSGKSPLFSVPSGGIAMPFFTRSTNGITAKEQSIPFIPSNGSVTTNGRSFESSRLSGSRFSHSRDASFSSHHSASNIYTFSNSSGPLSPPTQGYNQFHPSPSASSPNIVSPMARSVGPSWSSSYGSRRLSFVDAAPSLMPPLSHDVSSSSSRMERSSTGSNNAERTRSMESMESVNVSAILRGRLEEDRRAGNLKKDRTSTESDNVSMLRELMDHW